MRDGWHSVDIGNVPQWLSVRGNASAPVLLFLHGGPGGSEFGPRRKFLHELEGHFRVVEWEQRGAGRSYRGDEEFDFERLVADGRQVLEWACHQLGAERVVLVGHSFGTVLGVRIAQEVPARIAAYVGAGQVVRWATQEKRGYEWALAEARRQGHAKALRALARLGPPVEGMYAMGVRGVELERRWLGTLGGVTADRAFLWRFVSSIFTCRHYPLSAKLRYLTAMRRSMALLWPELCRCIDLVRDATKLEVPVHLFAGRADHITPIDLVEEWLSVLDAPSKRLDIVEDAGHLNLYESPARFIAFLAPVAVLSSAVRTG
jgi:pimeloyl-ACP methyl ester carboxylesterase